MPIQVIDVTSEPCSICVKRDKEKITKSGARRCDCCGEPIAKMTEMYGSGFQGSCDHSHYSGERLLVTLNPELCKDCYLKDFEATYPGAPLPDLSKH